MLKTLEIDGVKWYPIRKVISERMIGYGRTKVEQLIREKKFIPENIADPLSKYKKLYVPEYEIDRFLKSRSAANR